MGEENQPLLSDPKDLLEKEQANSHLAATLGANPSELEGCFKVTSNLPSSRSFDDVVNIKFSESLLNSPNPSI